MSDAYQAADAGLVTLLGLLDLSAAFDTVDHQILLKRLTHEYGITGRVIEWIQSYLTGRTQFVRFNGTTSQTMAVTSGVPQGSVLGPVLFIAYSAGVINIVEHHGLRAHGYADDLQVYGHTAQDDVSSLVVRMVACIEHVKSWMTSNRLRLNPSKTELIWLGSSRPSPPLSCWQSQDIRCGHPACRVRQRPRRSYRRWDDADHTCQPIWSARASFNSGRSESFVAPSPPTPPTHWCALLFMRVSITVTVCWRRVRSTWPTSFNRSCAPPPD